MRLSQTEPDWDDQDQDWAPIPSPNSLRKGDLEGIVVETRGEIAVAPTESFTCTAFDESQLASRLIGSALQTGDHGRIFTDGTTEGENNAKRIHQMQVPLLAVSANHDWDAEFEANEVPSAGNLVTQAGAKFYSFLFQGFGGNFCDVTKHLEIMEEAVERTMEEANREARMRKLRRQKEENTSPAATNLDLEGTGNQTRSAKSPAYTPLEPITLENNASMGHSTISSLGDTYKEYIKPRLEEREIANIKKETRNQQKIDGLEIISKPHPWEDQGTLKKSSQALQNREGERDPVPVCRGRSSTKKTVKSTMPHKQPSVQVPRSRSRSRNRAKSRGRSRSRGRSQSRQRSKSRNSIRSQSRPSDRGQVKKENLSGGNRKGKTDGKGHQQTNALDGARKSVLEHTSRHNQAVTRRWQHAQSRRQLDDASQPTKGGEGIEMVPFTGDGSNGLLLLKSDDYGNKGITTRRSFSRLGRARKKHSVAKSTKKSSSEQTKQSTKGSSRIWGLFASSKDASPKASNLNAPNLSLNQSQRSSQWSKSGFPERASQGEIDEVIDTIAKFKLAAKKLGVAEEELLHSVSLTGNA